MRVSRKTSLKPQTDKISEEGDNILETGFEQKIGKGTWTRQTYPTTQSYVIFTSSHTSTQHNYNQNSTRKAIANLVQIAMLFFRGYSSKKKLPFTDLK